MKPVQMDTGWSQVISWGDDRNMGMSEKRGSATVVSSKREISSSGKIPNEVPTKC
jgi:hypothetical protein